MLLTTQYRVTIVTDQTRFKMRARNKRIDTENVRFPSGADV